VNFVIDSNETTTRDPKEVVSEIRDEFEHSFYHGKLISQ
jgi:hypothetical protein